MVTAVKRLLVGNPLKTKQAFHKHLTKETAQAIASGHVSVFHYVVPISIGITVPLATLVGSDRQTIHAYPGRGVYIVAKENLGTTPVLRRENY